MKSLKASLKSNKCCPKKYGDLCDEYADLGFCLYHGYFPLSFVCLHCSVGMTERDKGVRENWNWYDLTMPREVTSSHGEKELHLLDKEHDSVLIHHLKTIKTSFEVHWISKDVLKPTAKLSIGITEHYRCGFYLLLIVSSDDTDTDLEQVLKGRKWSYLNYPTFHGFELPLKLHQYIDY